MRTVKVKIVGTGKEEDPYTVELPTWIMIGEIDHNKEECQVFVPDDEVKTDGTLDQERIRSKYKEGWSEFNASDVEV